jgi:hypothetical protein
VRFHPVLDRVLSTQIDVVSGNGENVAAFGPQSADDSASYHSPVTGNPYALAGELEA